MNPDTNRFEPLTTKDEEKTYNKDQEIQRYKKQMEKLQHKMVSEIPLTELVRPDGSAVPQNWSIFTVGEHLVLKDYTYRVVYLNEVSITLEPVGPVVVGDSG